MLRRDGPYRPVPHWQPHADLVKGAPLQLAYAWRSSAHARATLRGPQRAGGIPHSAGRPEGTRGDREGPGLLLPPPPPPPGLSRGPLPSQEPPGPPSENGHGNGGGGGFASVSVGPSFGMSAAFAAPMSRPHGQTLLAPGGPPMGLLPMSVPGQGPAGGGLPMGPFHPMMAAAAMLSTMQAAQRMQQTGSMPMNVNGFGGPAAGGMHAAIGHGGPGWAQAQVPPPPPLSLGLGAALPPLMQPPGVPRPPPQ